MISLQCSYKVLTKSLQCPYKVLKKFLQFQQLESKHSLENLDVRNKPKDLVMAMKRSYLLLTCFILLLRDGQFQLVLVNVLLQFEFVMVTLLQFK